MPMNASSTLKMICTCFIRDKFFCGPMAIERKEMLALLPSGLNDSVPRLVFDNVDNYRKEVTEAPRMHNMVATSWRWVPSHIDSRAPVLQRLSKQATCRVDGIIMM